jgi:D-arabinose 1-dehydrogenase-like Zn-dependent alcohol dehydrogenase
MLKFCSEHEIYPDCKLVEANQIDSVWDELATNNKDGIRYVIDVKKSLANPDFIPN